MDCRVCKTERLSMMERRGIELDYCLTCRGVWLDRGDHDKVVERPAAELAAAAPAAAPAPVATLQPYAPQARYDSGHRPRNDDRSAGGHRRKSFLQELNIPPFSSRGRWGTSLLLAAALTLLDQSVKAFVATSLPLGSSVAVTPWFNLVHVLNPGAAFSFLADAGGWQRHVLSAIGIVISLALAVLLWRGVRSRLETAAHIGLIGGALGNVIDRLRIGAVVDYLDLYWREMHWPAFNLADVFVVGGVGLLLLASFQHDTAAKPRGRTDVG